jgi:general secretion pathway protein D
MSKLSVPEERMVHAIGRLPLGAILFAILFFSHSSSVLAQNPEAVSASRAPALIAAPNSSYASDSADVMLQSDMRTETSDKPRIEIFRGTEGFVRPSSRNSNNSAEAPGDMTLDFADADVHDVIRAVLGDMLNKPFVIDPQVSGHITLKTGTPISRDAIIPALETALKMNGDALVMTGGIYNVVPLPAAQRHGQISIASGRAGMPGFGIEIVPLKYVAAEEMQKIIEPLAPGSIVRIDAERDLVFLAGTEPERTSVKETIALFDTNYLEGMSFALVQPAHVDVGALATELGKIFDETSSPIAGLVRMVPITRINTLLVITARASYLQEVKKWVERLDIAPISPGRQLHYYRLQNARAKDIAQTLSQLFGSESSGGIPSVPNISAQPSAPFGQHSEMGTPQVQPDASPVAAGPANITNGEAPQIVTDESNNALIIRADAADYDSIQRILRQMDVVPDQVLVEVTIVEVTLDDQTYTLSPSGSVAQHFPGFGFSYIVPNVSVALSALGSLTRLSVLSSPKLLTLDNKAAMLEVGDEVPVVTQTATSTVAGNAPLVSTVAERNTGVILSVTPRIGHSGMVFLDVSQEVSDVIPTTTSGIDSPTIQERKLQATVGIKDGNTVALGGLIRRSVSGGDSGIPYLKDIPLLGNLFRTTSDTRDRTELLIFLTPHVVRSDSEAVSMTGDLSKSLDDIHGAVEDLEKHENIPRGLLH